MELSQPFAGSPRAVPPSPLADLALLSLVIAHGTDANLDPRETRELVHQLDVLSDVFGIEQSGSDLSHLVEGAVLAYGDLRVRGLDEVVARLNTTLDDAQRSRALGALVRIADADGVVHTMEATVLRHLAHAWGVRA